MILLIDMGMKLIPACAGVILNRCNFTARGPSDPRVCGGDPKAFHVFTIERD